ncbi:S8 family peptidase [Desmospora profundinema]|uniref:Serine protease AprX n=1 Tax=Desmospora profundinema TaxID=1571184 RepID=A0ABU1IM63_9BACL|nr:S8 family peptidase [Desmospora profundinema]MDR6225833.1 serine protease AprX [Desmospora profundinema]
MGRERERWFQQSKGRLDPGLVEVLLGLQEAEPKEEETSLPVIIRLNDRVNEEKRQQAIQRCRDGSCNSLDGELKLSDSVFGRLSPATIQELLDYEAIEKVFYDRPVKAFLDVAGKFTGAVDVRLEEGLSGEGVTIAVLDTGIHPHPDLTLPQSRIDGFIDWINGKAEPYDDQGHGTHCAGDAAGNGNSSEGLYTAPAPGARLLGLKVLDENGGGRLSTVIQGVEWCVENREQHRIRILSLSLGAPAYESHREDPLCLAVEKAWHTGIAVFVAAGNEGPEPGTISTPGISPAVITVGSMDDRDTVDVSDDEKAPYSSRGPTADAWVKPDIYAPGTSIVSLSVPGSPLEKQFPENRVGEHYIRLSGTSMAAPFCAGVAALLLEVNPQLSPNDVKSILMQTARAMEGDDPAGVVDVKQAVALAKQYLQFQEGLVETR